MSADSKASPNVKGAAFDPKQTLNPARALVPAVIQVNEQRVAKGFWPKIRRTAAKIPFAGDALSVWFCARDPATPRTAKAMMMAALAYFVLPADAIPDVLAVVGFTDDAAVFAALMALVGKNLKPRHREAAQGLLAQMKRDDD
ncbi:YkvA family protein [Phenylobacterium sp.]|uniref:YkvA family protein n=1 Tax=Phenylobacterium sp. TaxID=1871053 RepID=UPI002736659C|nr:YkvA family protein [Phenylobacterium sp.]MDP3854564.1 YkvA family protein [Phenylobacterium sp.]